MVLMKYSCLLIVLVLILPACNEKSEEKITIPRHVLPRKKFIRVTCDLALAESASALNIKNVGSEKYDSVYAFNVFKDNSTSKQQYDTSISFYAEHPKLYKELLDSVLSRLSREQSKLQINHK
jgi:hypothetical protein